MKKWLLAFVCLFALCLCAGALAETSEVVVEEETVAVDLDYPTNALAEGFINSLFATPKTGGPRKAPRDVGSRLSGSEAKAYQALVPEIIKVANGEETSTVFSFPSEQIYAKTTYTAEELGFSSILTQTDGETALVAGASEALKEIKRFDLQQIVDAIMADHPYELYWYDKTVGVSYRESYSLKASNTELSFSGTVTFTFAVVQEYAGAAENTVSTSFGQSAITAAANAKAIVAKHSGENDLTKLNSYRTEICDLVAYNHAAADNSSTPYGNPWQLVWVFDRDTTTKVVCEGYAKAFQYLCDSSAFSADITAISVTGTMNGGTGEGRHMWNLVRMNNGLNYLVDITNCDEGTVGYPDQLFLVGYTSGSAASGYAYSTASRDIIYIYDNDLTNLYRVDELEVADTPYDPANTGIRINATSFPDEAFRAYVSESFDTDRNGWLSESEAAAVQEIHANNLGIQSLQGVELFPELEVLWVQGNQLTQLDLSRNTKLQVIDCSMNKLTALDVHDLPELVDLSCWSNALTSLDLRSNSKLDEAWCADNQLTSIQLNQEQSVLSAIDLERNHLSTIDLSHQAQLNSLFIAWNRLDELDLSDCPVLIQLYQNAVVEDKSLSGWETAHQWARGINYLTADVTTIVYTEKPQSGWVRLDAANFPDEAFRAYVSESFDTDHNDSLDGIECSVVSIIELTDSSIQNLEGIDFFPYLKTLRVGCDTAALTWAQAHPGAYTLVAVHAWKEPVFTFAEDYQSATAVSVCSRNAAHIKEIPSSDIKIYSDITAEPQCVIPGATHYTAHWAGDDELSLAFAGVDVPIPALGHAWGEVTYSWSDDNTTVTATRTCGHDGAHVEKETAKTTVETLEATYTAPGKTTYTASFTNQAFETQVKEIEIPQLTPTAAPTATPTAEPTATPTAEPTASPTVAPTAIPAATPTAEPTATPTAEPTASPTAAPTATPTPTTAPTTAPTATPTAEPTASPTAAPTATPTPTPTPTTAPTATPTAEPTASPTAAPTVAPTATPTAEPTATPTTTLTAEPTATPTAVPTASPTAAPTATPTATPTAKPTATPTATPTAEPTTAPVTPVQGYTDPTTGATVDIAVTNGTATATYKKPAKSAATVTVPDTVTVNGQAVPVTKIADKAFQKDTKLKTLTIGKNVTSIGKNAFASCTKLKTIKGGAAVTSIGANAFKGDKVLTSISLKKVKTIGSAAFSGCVKLKTVTLGTSLTTVGANAFKGCKVLTKITLGKNVKSIGKNAFNGCTKLKIITINTTKLTTKNVGANAFKGISKKATFKVPKAKLKAYKTLVTKKGAPKTVKVK